MKRLRADLHIHTVLSACADLEMSPANIVNTALRKKIDLIAITDHNSTLQCRLVKELAEEKGLSALYGVEVTTREEVHCLAYFEDLASLALFQQYLDKHLPRFPYSPGKFGYQLLVDREEKITGMVENYLNAALGQSIDQVEQEVHRLGGLFVPAHIERPMYGIFNQLGFIPGTLCCDALGIMRHSSEAEIRRRFRLDSGTALLKASDAHSLEDIGTGCTWFELNDLSFDEIKQALLGLNGRKTTVE
jgi:PHP family Zn ribbon phosphoesterase